MKKATYRVAAKKTGQPVSRRGLPRSARVQPRSGAMVVHAKIVARKASASAIRESLGIRLAETRVGMAALKDARTAGANKELGSKSSPPS